jgi:hypothetical protein
MMTRSLFHSGLGTSDIHAVGKTKLRTFNNSRDIYEFRDITPCQSWGSADGIATGYGLDRVVEVQVGVG